MVAEETRPESKLRRRQRVQLYGHSIVAADRGDGNIYEIAYY